MLSLIAAISSNNCIGKNGTLPWHLPADLKHFKQITSGRAVMMGRKTWESLPEKFRPLPNRTNIIITRNNTYERPEGVKVYTSINQAIEAHPDEELIVIGGGELYKQTIDLADTLYITHVDRHVDGDTFFPQIDTNLWKESEKESHDGFHFVTYTRV